MKIRIFYDDDSSVIAEVGEDEENESELAESTVDSSSGDDSGTVDDALGGDGDISASVNGAVMDSTLDAGVVEVLLSELIEILSKEPEERSFMDTPLDDYTVTEGLLLLILVFSVIGVVVSAFRGR